MGLATSRWLTIFFFTTRAALRKAVSTAPASPICHLKATLDGATSWICALVLASALSVALTAGSTSQVTFTLSAASWAASCVSAMTIATGSPT